MRREKKPKAKDSPEDQPAQRLSLDGMTPEEAIRKMFGAKIKKVRKKPSSPAKKQ